jgi:hypothetical protein
MSKPNWEELVTQHIAANTATYHARQRWHSAIRQNPLNKNAEEIKAIQAERDAAKVELERCHKKALEISEAADAARHIRR